MDDNKEYSLQDYEVVIPSDDFYNAIKCIHLPDYYKARILVYQMNKVYG